MVQFNILSGKRAGTSWVARRFPVRVGRAAQADLRVEEPGVWDQHARLELDRAVGFVLHAEPNALVSVNGEPVQEARLRNGDTLELGSLKLQFWLAETRQQGVRLREAITWTGLVLLGLSQVALIYLLLQS